MADPYETLGVAKDADAATIKKAHRKRVKETHPDQNEGEGDDFRRVQQAYLVLSDPDRRKRYDETGDEGEASVRSPEEAEDAEARQMLGHLVVQGLAKPDYEIDFSDLRADILNTLKLLANKHTQDKGEAQRQIKRAEKVAKRWKRKPKAKEGDLIGAMIGAQIADLHRRVAAMERAERVTAKCRAMLDDYEYAHDDPRKNPQDMQRIYAQIAREEFGSMGGGLFDTLNRRR